MSKIYVLVRSYGDYIGYFDHEVLGVSFNKEHLEKIKNTYTQKWSSENLDITECEIL